MSEVFKDKLERLKENKYFKIAIISICLILMLIAFLGIFKSNKKVEKTQESPNDYVFTLERQLANNLVKIEGVSNVSVMITVEGGNQTIIAMETATTTDVKGNIIVTETPVLVGGKVVVLQELNPKISGILVVAKGAKNLITMQKIQSAVVTLTGVDINKIEIIEMK